MISCPRCQQLLKSQAVNCPHCGLVLKAYGHPGIPLHHAGENEFLCDSCTYHIDDTCNYSKRPHARECTLYQDCNQPQPELRSANYQPSTSQAIVIWLKRYLVWIVLIVLVLISFVLAAG